jgi:DNA-binding CsgD family transcriptional regulator
VPRPFLTKPLAEIGGASLLTCGCRCRSRRARRRCSRCLREGLTTAEIAGRPFVSQVTSLTHICSIVKKLEVPDRAAAVRLLSASGELVDEQGNIASEVAVGAPAALELARTGASATPAA